MPGSDDRACGGVPCHGSNHGPACRTPSSVSSSLSVRRALAVLVLRLLLLLLLLVLRLLVLRLGLR